jgi:molybdenum cofactor cytidylyltransferase
MSVLNNPEPKLILLILAAGEGRRFGGIKQLALIDGKPLLRSVIENTSAPELYRTVVVVGAHACDVCASITDLDVVIIENKEWQSGISSSIRSGVEYVAQLYPNADGLLIALGDQWRLNRTHIGELVKTQAQTREYIIATAYDERGGVPAFFPKKFWPMLKALSGDKGAGQVLNNVGNVILVDIPDALGDIDFLEDL